MHVRRGWAAGRGGGALGLMTRLKGKISSNTRTMSDFFPRFVALPPSCATVVVVVSPLHKHTRSHPPFFLA